MARKPTVFVEEKPKGEKFRKLADAAGKDLPTSILATTTPRRRGVAEVSAIPVESRTRLHTFTPVDAIWSQVASGEEVRLGDLDGAFVRLCPPAEVESETIALLEATMRAAGARAVKVLPSPKKSVFPGKSATDSRASSKTAREVIDHLVDVAVTRDRVALRKLVDECVDGEGI